MFKPGDNVRIIREYRVQYADPIHVAAGEVVVMEREDDAFPGWIWCRATDGRQGWIPIELLARNGREAILRQDYTARELGVQPGEEVVVLDSRRGWLKVRNTQGECGWIPEVSVEGH